MASAQVERLLRDMAADGVVPVHYSRQSLPVRVVLLLVFVL